MLARIDPRWVFLFTGITCLSTSLATQRRVVVSSSKGLDLRSTAHRLGVSVERVEQGRKALQVATDLAPEVVGRESVGSLGDSWLRLNWSEAESQIVDLIKELRRFARTTEDPGSYGRVTSDAPSLKSTLLLIDEATARQILDNWPDPPEGEGPAPRRPSPARQMNDMRRMQQLAMNDLDAALEMLSDLEGGRPNPGVRSSLLYQLESRGRNGQADQLFAEMLEAMPTVQDGSQAQGYNSLVYWVARYRPQMLDDFLPLWADLMRSFPSPAPRSFPSSLLGLDLLPEERSIAIMLLGLNQMAPGVSEKILQHFPELARKLEAIGGLDEFDKASRQEWDRTMSGGNRSSDKDQEQTVEDVEREINRLLMEIQRRATTNPGKVSKNLGEAVGLLEKLEGQPEQLRSYVRVAGAHLKVQGELSRELMRMGWEILDEVAEEPFTQPPSPQGMRPGTRTPDELEIWLYAAWCWTDFEPAMKEVKALGDDLQYSVLTKFTGWLSGSQNFNIWSRSFQ